LTSILVLDTGGTVAREAARRVAAILRRPGEHTLLFASGKTMVPVYRELVRLHRRSRAPFRRARAFALDELSVPPEDPRSFRAFLDRHLFSRVGLTGERIDTLRGDADHPEAECRRYERKLRRARPDLALLGIGINGHVAYLEPARALPPATSLVRLSAATRLELAADGMPSVPKTALTVGIETILSARELLLVAAGRRKAPALAQALAGPITARFPASFLLLHPRLTVLLDRAAAKGLPSTVRPGSARS
jgi:glucosamine-6-phosphate deaminase